MESVHTCSGLCTCSMILWRCRLGFEKELNKHLRINIDEKRRKTLYTYGVPRIDHLAGHNQVGKLLAYKDLLS